MLRLIRELQALTAVQHKWWVEDEQRLGKRTKYQFEYDWLDGRVVPAWDIGGRRGHELQQSGHSLWQAHRQHNQLD